MPLAGLYLAFWFDCEDYTSPYEPTSLHRLADIFARRGLVATWKLVGEEARMLARAAAGDGVRDPDAARAAVRAIAAQDLGYHTDWHSVHPTVAEYCRGAGWQDGQRRFEEREAPGLAALRSVFPDRPVLCYGQPGGSWAPQAYPVLHRWGIPLYMDEAGHLGLDEQPFYYCGVLNVLRLRHLCLRHRGHRPPAEGAEAALRDLERVLAELRRRGGGLAQCWWHPNEWYTDQWWDGLNFGGGENRVAPGTGAAYRVPQPLPEAEREARYAATEAFIDAVARRSDVRVVGARDIVRLYPDAARGRTFEPAELRRVAEAMAETVTYQVHDGFALSAAEAAYLLAQALAQPGVPGPATLDRSPEGPVEPAATDVPSRARLEDVRALAAALVQAVNTGGRLPDALPLAGGRADPACAAAALAAGYLAASAGTGSAAVPLRPARLAAADHVRGDGVWDWSIFPPGFDAPDLIDIARRQAWTLKPALPAPGA